MGLCLSPRSSRKEDYEFQWRLRKGSSTRNVAKSDFSAPRWMSTTSLTTIGTEKELQAMKVFGVYDKMSTRRNREHRISGALPTMWAKRPEGAEVRCEALAVAGCRCGFGRSRASARAGGRGLLPPSCGPVRLGLAVVACLRRR